MLVNQSDFLQTLWDYYQTNGRHDLLWRESDVDGNFDPYRILVSEIMLQQTQVNRVTPKFNEFLINFPDVRSLASATLADVLALWSGLGYNRRAKFLWQAAQYVTGQCNGVFPQTSAELQKLPGVGKNTAGAIMAYAFNQPEVFIETNIRTVYIHHFFADQGGVTDAAIYEVLQATIDQKNPREFYWALMDYGSHLKQTVGNLNKQSKGYVKQSAFKGSKRQVRGQVLKVLAGRQLNAHELAEYIPDERLPTVLVDLVNEQLIQQTNDTYRL